MKNKIKKCPFCGGKAELFEFKESKPYESGYYYSGEHIFCKCGAEFKEYADEDFAIKSIDMTNEEETEYKNQLRDILIKKWNKRL